MKLYKIKRGPGMCDVYIVAKSFAGAERVFRSDENYGQIDIDAIDIVSEHILVQDKYDYDEYENTGVVE